MHVRRRRRFRAGDDQLAAHAQVDEQRRLVVERQPQELAPPAGARDRAVDQASGELPLPARLAAHRAVAQHPRTSDAPASDVRIEAQADGLDLGEFRHPSP